MFECGVESISVDLRVAGIMVIRGGNVRSLEHLGETNSVIGVPESMISVD